MAAAANVEAAPRRCRRPAPAVRCLLVWLAAAPALWRPASAALFVVTSVADDPANPLLSGTLRAALTVAATIPGASHAITFSPALNASAAISLGSPLPPFSPGPGQLLSINGTLPGGPPGARAEVSAAGTARLVALVTATNGALGLTNIVFRGVSLAAAFGAKIATSYVLFSGAGHDQGRALTLSLGASLTAFDSAFEDHMGYDSADWATAAGGAVLLLGAGSATFERCTFSRNYAPPSARFGSSGGAVYATGMAGPLVCSSCVFFNNTSGHGGALAVWNGTAAASLTLTGSVFDSNRADGSGGSAGAVAVHNTAQVNVTGCTFVSNRAADSTGALLADGCPGVVVSGSTVVGNTAYYAPGVTVNQCPGAAFTSNNFTENKSSVTFGVEDLSGGGLRVNATAGVSIARCSFTSNKGLYGGALVLLDSSGASLLDLEFVDNFAKGRGGSVLVLSSYGVTVARATFSGSSCQSNGCGMAVGSSRDVSLVDSSFTNSKSSDSGGGVTFDYSTNVEIARVNLTGGEAVNAGGGGMFLGNTNLTLTDVAFTGNAITLDDRLGGGAFFSGNSGGTRLVRVQFIGNKALNRVGDGAGCAIHSNDVEIIDCLFQANEAVTQGGGLFIRDSANVRVLRTSFIGNKAASGGGAHVLRSSNVLFSEASFVGGNTAGDGGGLAISESSPGAAVSSCLFQGNSATGAGGGLSVQGVPSFSIKNSTIKANAAVPDLPETDEGFGGGLFISGCGTGSVEDCSIEQNYANHFGGGIYVDSSNTTFRRVTSSNNVGRRAGGGGVGVLQATSVEFYDSLFEGNSGASLGSSGGGSNVHVRGTTAYLKLVRCLITGGKINNTAWFNGGLSVSSGAVAEVRECTIDSNAGATATGSQVWVDYGAALTMTSSTVVDNTGAPPIAGSAINFYQASGSIFNTLIVTPNSNAIQLGGGTTAASVTAKASLLRGGWGTPSDGNTDTSNIPLRLGPLADNGGPTRTRMPQLGSPAIDAGSNALLGPDDATDQRGPGFPRIVCDTVDAGAVEAPIQAPQVYTSAAPVYNTSRDTTLSVPAPGILVNSGPGQLFIGTQMAAVLVAGPSHGSLHLQTNGAFNYTPSSRFRGMDSFVVRAERYCSGYNNLTSGPATIYILVWPSNANPVVLDKNYTTNESTPLAVPAASGLLAGATDADNDPLTVVGYSQPQPARGGTVVVSTNGSFLYTPGLYFYGRVSFVFNASDGYGGYASGLVLIDVAQVNRAPYAIVNGVPVTTGSPATTVRAYRNTPLLIPALGLLPSGQPSPSGTALFGDPENDTMTLTLVTPPGLGSVALDPATGAISFKPPYMKKNDPWLSTSMVLQAADTFGLKSPLLNVTIVVGGKPPVDTPSINAFNLHLTSCSPGGVNIDTFSVTAGSLALLDKNGDPAVVKGVPSGMAVQVAPAGAPFPNDTSADGGKRPPCIIKVPGKVAAQASRSWDYGSCQRCLACLKEMSFNCSAGPYKIRVQATAKDSADWTDSAWSEPYVFQPTCEGKALTCYPVP